MSRVAQWAKWTFGQIRPRRINDDDLQQQLLALGRWLEQRDYIGHDVRTTYPPQEISTVAAFAMMGWINLYHLTGNATYRDKAQTCLARVHDTQTAEGVWPFPYAFRKNPPGHIYACESFMTLRALLYYGEQMGPAADLYERIEQALSYLLTQIGSEDGIFWYSATDHVRVPNISSMAANVLARAGQLLDKPEWITQAGVFADYCLAQQRVDGAYPYYEEIPRVYIPYHALETWELDQANEILGEPRIASSTQRAIDYLGQALNISYDSYDDQHDGGRLQLFKTPLWSAKAYLSHNQPDQARHHLVYAMRRFRAPDQACYLYILHRRRMGPLTLSLPSLRSDFVRYNASCFEIGTRWLLSQKERLC